MKLVVISDIHESLDAVGALHAKLSGAGALVVCGDFTTFGGLARVQRIVDAVRLEGIPLYFVPGNCDSVPADVSLEGGCNLHGRVLEHDGWLFAGLGGSLPCPGHTPSEYPEAAYAGLLDGIRGACESRAERLILVSHQPPYGTEADLLPSGLHVGCHALRAFIDEVQPACCLTGHIHEAVSESRVGRTVVLNPGPFSRGYIGVLTL